MYEIHEYCRGGWGDIRTFLGGVRILVPAANFFRFSGGFLDCLMYSCSISFKELKNAIKEIIIPLFRGSGAKIRILSKEIWGRISGPAGKNIG